MFADHGLVKDISSGGELKITHTLPPGKDLELYDLNPIVEILNDINAMITAGFLQLVLQGNNEIHLTCTDRLSIYGKVTLDNSILHNPDIEDSVVSNMTLKVDGRIIRIRGNLSTHN